MNELRKFRASVKTEGTMMTAASTETRETLQKQLKFLKGKILPIGGLPTTSNHLKYSSAISG